MLRTLLIAATLAASGSALAHGGDPYGRVVTADPYVSITYGSRHDGFRVFYESGGARYWREAPYPVERVIVVPAYRERVRYVYRDRDEWHDHDDWHDRDGPPGWKRHHRWHGGRDWD